MHYSLFLPYLRRYWLTHRKTFKASKIKYLSLILTKIWNVLPWGITEVKLMSAGCLTLFSSKQPLQCSSESQFIHGNWEGEEEILHVFSCLPSIPAANHCWSQDLRVSGVFFSSNKVMFFIVLSSSSSTPERTTYYLQNVLIFDETVSLLKLTNVVLTSFRRSFSRC